MLRNAALLLELIGISVALFYGGYFWIIYDGEVGDTYRVLDEIFYFLAVSALLTFLILVGYDRRGRRIVFDEQNWQVIKSAALFGWFIFLLIFLVGDVLFYWTQTIDQHQLNMSFVVALLSPNFYLLVQRIRGRYG